MVTKYQMYRDQQAECYCEMEEHEKGNFVSVDDYNKIESELAALKQRLAGKVVISILDAGLSERVAQHYFGPTELKNEYMDLVHRLRAAIILAANGEQR